METNEKHFILCPVCRRDTKVKANPDTELKRFPLYCPWCKEEYIVDKAKEDGAEKRSAVSCAARGQEIRDLKTTMEVLILADRTILYDRIKHLGKSYIARGYVTLEELEDLNRMPEVYHDPDKLNGNGFLDGLMTTVRSLPLRAA